MRDLNGEALEHVARYFGALAVPMRLKILNALRDGELNVSELTTRTGATQANVSKHLALLTQCGLVERSSRGTSAYYRIADPATYQLCDLVCSNIHRRLSTVAGVTALFAMTNRSEKKARRRSSRR